MFGIRRKKISGSCTINTDRFWISNKGTVLIILSLFLAFTMVSCSGWTDDSENVAADYAIYYGDQITEIETAKQFALDFSFVDSNDVRFNSEEYDSEKHEYRLKYSSGQCNYECHIDADAGLITKYEFDGSLSAAKSGRILGQSEIRAMILQLDPDVDEAKLICI